MLSQRQEQNTDLAAANPSKKSGYLFFAEEMSCLYERAETEKQLQAAVWVQHHAQSAMRILSNSELKRLHNYL